jgi:flagellar export protein FliJ
MKPFSFRLDRIRRYRGYREKKARVDLAMAKNEQRELERVIHRLASERRELAKRCSDEVFAGMSVPLYMMYGSLLERLRSEIEEAHVELNQAQQRVRARERALLRESMGRKALETLKDLRHARYTENLEREEQKGLDELVIQRRGSRS